jgi:hypothetical protein
MTDTAECASCAGREEWKEQLRTRLDRARQDAEHALLNDDPPETSREFLAGMATGVGVALDAVTEEEGGPAVKGRLYVREVTLRTGEVITGKPELLRENDLEAMAQSVQDTLRDGLPLSLKLGGDGQRLIVDADHLHYFQVRPVKADQ